MLGFGRDIIYGLVVSHIQRKRDNARLPHVAPAYSLYSLKGELNRFSMLFLSMPRDTAGGVRGCPIVVELLKARCIENGAGSSTVLAGAMSGTVGPSSHFDQQKTNGFRPLGGEFQS